MTNSFRVEASEMQSWHRTLSARMDLRGVPAIAKEMEAHLMKKAEDGTVVVTRHQLFTWAEALSGAAARDPQGKLVPVVDDIRAILTGKPAGAPRPAAGPSIVETMPAQTSAPYAASPPATSAWGAPAPPPVTYVTPGAAAAASGKVVTGNDLANGIRELLRGARSEVCISSPWATGIETLVADIVGTDPTVKVLILSRRPDRDSPEFHKAMDQLGRRKAITAWSPYIQTRYVIADSRAAVVGAASVPGPSSREAGIAITDAATVAALRAHFDRVHVEAAGGRY